MSFTSAAATVATKGTETLRELPMPTWAYGAIALACFFALLGVLWCFRNTAAKYDKPSGAVHGDVRASRGSRGTSDHGANH
jgi:hypothetical protein